MILFTLAGFGIGFGYSQFDKDFKKKIESVVPYAEEGFKTIESVYDSYVKPIFTRYIICVNNSYEDNIMN